MNSIIILYLAVLAFFSAAYLYRGFKLKTASDDSVSNQNIRRALKSRDNDVIDFNKINKLQTAAALTAGSLILLLIAVTFISVDDLTGTPSAKDIHLMRTLIIALLVIFFSKEVLTGALKEKFIERKESDNPGLNLRNGIFCTVLWITFLYSLYTQMTYQW
jgi:hypothetical protein